MADKTPIQKTGKRKRPPNKRYLSSPDDARAKPKAGKRAGRPKKTSKPAEEVTFGAMFKALVVDEIKQMAKEQLKLSAQVGNQ